MNYGLSAHPLIQWLLSNEPDVCARVGAFIERHGDDHVVVAGPPDDDQRAMLRRDPFREIELPTVLLKFTMVYHPRTGEPGVEVTCSLSDLSRIQQWQRLVGKAPRAVNGHGVGT